MSYLNDTINEFLGHICLSITILFTITNTFTITIFNDFKEKLQ